MRLIIRVQGGCVVQVLKDAHPTPVEIVVVDENTNEFSRIPVEQDPMLLSAAFYAAAAPQKRR
jgi:hypothetical protein